MKIGELARVTGVKAETVRFYEGIGLLPAPDRTESNYRDYGADDRERRLVYSQRTSPRL